MAMSLIEKKLAAQEQKVGSWLEKNDRSNRLREASLTRLEERVALQPTYEKRYAECAGTVKGLVNEIQDQTRRIGTHEQQSQDNLQSLKEHLEEQIRENYTALDKRINEISSKQNSQKALFEASFLEVTQKRLKKFEQECTTSIHRRLELMEGFSESRANKEAKMKDMKDDALELAMFDRHLEDMSRKVEKVWQESSDACKRVSANEEQVRTLRTLLDRKDEQFRWLCERLEKATHGKAGVSDVDRQLNILTSCAASAVNSRVGQCTTHLDKCKNHIAELSTDMRTLHLDQQLEDLRPNFNEICIKHNNPADKSTFNFEKILNKEQEGNANVSLIVDQEKSMEEEGSTETPSLTRRIEHGENVDVCSESENGRHRSSVPESEE